MVALRHSMRRKTHSSSSPWTSSRSKGRLGEERPSMFVGSPARKEEVGRRTWRDRGEIMQRGYEERGEEKTEQESENGEG